MKIICHDWSTVLDIVNRVKYDPPVTLFVEIEGKRIETSSRGTALSKLTTHPQRSPSGTGRYVITDERTGDYVTLIKRKETME